MRKLTLFDMTHAERIAYFRQHPPQLGTNANAYSVGMRGLPNLLFPRGSVSASAYRAGLFNGRADRAKGVDA